MIQTLTTTKVPNNNNKTHLGIQTNGICLNLKK